MNLHEAQNLTYSLMKEHGLIERGWSFKYDNSVRQFGLCNYRRKTIQLSKHLVSLNDVSEVTDTILHEIAHALTQGDGHGSQWKAMCRKIGAKPERCYNRGSRDVVTPKLKYVGTCPSCNTEYQKAKNPQGKTYTCRCRPKGLRQSFKFVERH